MLSLEPALQRDDRSALAPVMAFSIRHPPSATCPTSSCICSIVAYR